MPISRNAPNFVNHFLFDFFNFHTTRNQDDVLVFDQFVPKVSTGFGDDEVFLAKGARKVSLGFGDDELVSDGYVRRVDAGFGNDTVTLNEGGGKINLGFGHDELVSDGFVWRVNAGFGNDKVTLNEGAKKVDLGFGNDDLLANGFVKKVDAGFGNDTVVLNEGAGKIFGGRGNDDVTVSGDFDLADGGSGSNDNFTLADASSSDFDFQVFGNKVILSDKFTGEEKIVKNFETVEFDGDDASFTILELREEFGPDATPTFSVGAGTQAITVNNADPTVSVVWDRAVQQAVVDNDLANGPTIASRAYSVLHTAMYDAWASYDALALRVSIDHEGDNGSFGPLSATEDNKIKAMSIAAYTVLNDLFPAKQDLYLSILNERYGLNLEIDGEGNLIDDGSQEFAVGLDAAEDLLILRASDDSNQGSNYSPLGSRYEGDPANQAGPDAAGRSIERWTAEEQPVDSGGPVQSFLTPHWGNVETFSLAETDDGSVDFVDLSQAGPNGDPLLPEAPRSFFTDAFAGSSLNLDDRTITFDQDVIIDGMVEFMSGETVFLPGLSAGDKDKLIGTVINEGFIRQAEDVVTYSKVTTDEFKLVAEFWEDGGGTAFPPGTWMTFAQFLSARDGHSTDMDAKLFLAMGNAVMDAGIATWETKIEYDYARPIRAIRDLGTLGLLGEEREEDGSVITEAVFDPVSGMMMDVPVLYVEAFGGFVDGVGSPREALFDTDNGVGFIPTTEFVTFQRPGDSSPPFAEYTSGHSAFSAAGARVLRLFNEEEKGFEFGSAEGQSDYFGATVEFAPSSSQFETGVPDSTVVLELDTFEFSEGILVPGSGGTVWNGEQELTSEQLEMLLTENTINELNLSAADQGGLSRLFGGIHFLDGDKNGRTLGEQVGESAFELAESFWNGTADDEDRPFSEFIV